MIQFDKVGSATASLDTINSTLSLVCRASSCVVKQYRISGNFGVVKL